MRKAMLIMFGLMIVSLVIGSMWNSLPFIKDNVHAMLEPTAGALLDWNVSWGMVVISLVITLLTTLLQKYTTDQNEIRRLKKEQKDIQEEVKKLEHDPEAAMKKQGEMLKLTTEMMDYTMRPMIYTVIPIILFFRWFNDYFAANEGVKIFGMLSWFWAYLIFSIVASIIFRKVLDVA